MYFGELAAGIVYLIAGVQLARLALRTREVPESLLAAMFVASGTSYLIYAVPLICDQESLWEPFNFAGRITYLPAPILIAAFTHRVFRPSAAWASFVVYVVAALLFTGVSMSVLQDDWTGFSIASPWFWLEWTGYTVPFAWAGVEAFLRYRQARRRRSLGLCEPIICNRFLLWSLFALLQMSTSLAVLPLYTAYDPESAFTAACDVLLGVLEVCSVATIWLIVFEPVLYRRWVNRTSAAARAVES